jgi:hypothetical protein
MAGIAVWIACNGTSTIDPPAPTTYQLVVIAGTGGTVAIPASSPVTVNKDAATAIKAQANAGYCFAEWTDTSGNASIAYKNSASTKVRLVSGNAVLQARFIPIVSPLTPLDISAFEKENGASYRYYKGTAWTSLPDFSALAPDSAGPCDSLDVIAVPHQAHNFGAVFAAYFNAPFDADYTFYLKSSDGSRLLLNDSVIINNDGVHASPVEDSATVALSTANSGAYLIEVRYFNASSSPLLWVGYSSSVGVSKQTISSALSRPSTAPVPKITVTKPAGGETFRLGGTVRVQWTYKNPRGQVFARVSADDGKTFSLISSRAFPADTNWYDWQIPANADSLISASAFIEVDEYPPYSLTGVSNRFTIAAAKPE